MTKSEVNQVSCKFRVPLLRSGDVQQVNIPAPQYYSNGVTELSNLSGLLDFHSWLKDAYQANPVSTNPRVEKRLASAGRFE